MTAQQGPGLDFQVLLEAAPNSYVVLDRSLRVVWANRAYLASTARPLAELVGLSMFEAFPGGESEPLLRSSLERVVREGKPDSIAFIRYAIPLPGRDGPQFEERFWSATHTPIFDDRGEVSFVLQHTVDVTDLYRLQQTAGSGAEASDVLRRARDVQQKSDAIDLERRHLLELFHQAPGFVAFLTGPDHVFELANESYYQLVGHRDLIGQPVRAAFPDIEGQGFLELLDQVFRTGMPFIGRDMRMTLGQRGGIRRDAYVDFIYQPITDEAGAVTGIFVLGNDVTARHEAEERKRLLMREVDHRAKNALAVVQALVRLTRSDSVEEFINAVDGRVAALARAHSVLAKNQWAGATLRDLLHLELAPYASGRQDRITIDGPPLSLASDAVQPFGMVIHELATNAAKYGALSSRDGRIAIGWTRTVAGDLVFRWDEIGGPGAAAPSRPGFGSEMITAAASGQLGGAAQFDWQPQGLKVTLRIDADRLVASDAGSAALAAGPGEPRLGPEALRGARVLLVEDDAIQALVIQGVLEEMGCDVLGPAASLDRALELARGEPHLTAAVLDVDLRGAASLPVAEVLAARRIPYLFATGHGDTIADMQGPLVLEKPFAPAQLVDALLETLARGRA